MTFETDRCNKTLIQTSAAQRQFTGASQTNNRKASCPARLHFRDAIPDV